MAFTMPLFAQVDLDRVALFFADGYEIAELETILQQMPVKRHEKWMEKKGYVFREEIPSKNALVYKKGEVVTLIIFLDKEHISEVRALSSPQKFYQAVDTFSKSNFFRPVEYNLRKESMKMEEGYKYWRNNGMLYYSSDKSYTNGVLADYPPDMDKSIPKAYLPPVIYVKGGRFKMGTDDTSDKDNIRPSFYMNLRSFSIGQFEVTVKQYQYFCRVTNRTFPKISESRMDERMPMTNITWDDANDYCQWLSYVTGKKYRLPFSAEWEFAAKGGTKSKGFVFAGSDFLEKVGWPVAKNQVDIRKVGSTYPNELDIYDMSSNVFEWCNDWSEYKMYESIAKLPESKRVLTEPGFRGLYKIIRGGTHFLPSESRVISFTTKLPNQGASSIGFRILMEED